MDSNLIYAIVGAVIGFVGATIGIIFSYYLSLKIRNKNIKKNLIQKMKYVLSDFRYIFEQCYISYVKKYSIEVPPLSPMEQVELSKSMMRDLGAIISDLYSLNVTKDFGKKIADIRKDAFELTKLLFNDTNGWAKIAQPNKKTDNKYQELMKKIDDLLHQTIE